MAQAYVLELANVMVAPNGVVQIPDLDSIVVDQAPIGIGPNALKSQAFGLNTKFIRVEVDSVCSFSYNALATQNNSRLAANQTEYFKVSPGAFISFIANS